MEPDASEGDAPIALHLLMRAASLSGLKGDIAVRLDPREKLLLRGEAKAGRDE